MRQDYDLDDEITLMQIQSARPIPKLPWQRMEWTGEQVTQLVRWRVRDKLSTRKIAELFGFPCTRNAVIGKCLRLGLPAPERYRRKGPRKRSHAPKPRPMGSIVTLQRPKGSVSRDTALRNSIHARAKAQKPPPSAFQQATAEIPPPPAIEPPTNPPVAFQATSSDQCGFPISGEPGPDMLCCGATVKSGTHWCPYHYWIVYRPVEKRDWRRFERWAA